MREKKHYTMLDPFQERYGPRMTGLLFLPAAFSDIFWAASIFYALGTTFSVVVGLSSEVSVIISAGVTVVYSFFGGLYSVAYTDIVQLAFMFIGLVSILPQSELARSWLSKPSSSRQVTEK